MCDNERLYTPYPRNNYRITQLEEMILKQGEMILKQNKKIELLEDKLADKIDVFHIGENVKYKTDIVSITDIQVEDDNIEYYTIKLKEGLERQVFKKDLTKININIETLQQKTNIQKFVFNIINNINRYYWVFDDDETYSIGHHLWGYRSSRMMEKMFANKSGEQILKMNHLCIQHSKTCTFQSSRFILYGVQFVPIYLDFKINSIYRTIDNDLIQHGLTQIPEGIKVCNWSELCNILGINNNNCIPVDFYDIKNDWTEDTGNANSDNCNIQNIIQKNINELLFYYHPDYLSISSIKAIDEKCLDEYGLRINENHRTNWNTSGRFQKHYTDLFIEEIIQQYYNENPHLNNMKIFNNPSDVLIKPKKEPNEFRYYTDVKV